MERDDIYINGSFEPASSADRIPVLDPSGGCVIAHVPACGAEDVDRAVSAARAAFDNGPWADTTGPDRARALTRLADALSEIEDQLAETVALEAGFAIRAALTVHVRQAIEFVRYYAELASGAADEEVRPGAATTARVRVRHCPVGVVATLVPWNIPLLGALAKIAPALAAGCTVVHKPSPETPLTSYLLADAVHKAGFPRGVVNILPADLEGSRRLVSHPGVDMVAFTGSTAVGREIAETCARDLRRYALELGGNAAAILLEDAPARLIAAGLAGTGIVMNNGEACIAQRRVLAPRSRYDEIVSLLAEAVRALPVGDPTDPKTVVGPMITRQHRDRVLGHVQAAVTAGAVVAAGGGIPAGRDAGFFVEPTVLADVTNEMAVAREEVFGPVLCVIAYDTIDEAIAIARDTEYGLSGSVWTADPERGAEIAARLRVGSVYVNGAMSLDPAIPFGGFGQSGVGRELGPEGLDEFRETQAVFVPAAKK
ncbi:aldehyde dehydrogenase [Nocardia nova]|nr:aldehyde dehydrogenase [Nocardia nova]